MKIEISRSLNADRCSYIDCVGFSCLKKNVTIDFRPQASFSILVFFYAVLEKSVLKYECSYITDYIRNMTSRTAGIKTIFKSAVTSPNLHLLQGFALFARTSGFHRPVCVQNQKADDKFRY